MLDEDNPELGWVDIEGANSSFYEFQVNEDNFTDSYRVVVTDAAAKGDIPEGDKPET